MADNDDYYVETLDFKDENQGPKEESKAPVTKNIPAPMTKDGEEVDEDNLYANPIQIGSKPVASKSDVVMKSEMPSDTYFVFMGQYFLHFSNDTWSFGDVQQPVGSFFSVPQYSSVVKLDPKLECSHSHAIILGGIAANGAMLNWGFGIEFLEATTTTGIERSLKMSYSDQMLLLPNQRMMHQACIVDGKAGAKILLVFGGKVGSLSSNCLYTNSVLGFDMKYIIAPWEKPQDLDGPKGEEGQVWSTLAPMESARANFAHMVIDNMVYAFGGIQGQDEGDRMHVPKLASVVCEKYDPVNNTWVTHNIEGAIPLAAFGWTALAPGSGQMLIMGGTDGDLLQEDASIIIFKDQKLEKQKNYVECQVAESKLVFNNKSNKTYCFGGFNSGGTNYCKKGDSKWEECQSHAGVMSQGSPDLDLVQFATCAFE